MLYLFRLRASITPAMPNPINASEPGSGTAAMLPPVIDLSFLQLLGSPLKAQSFPTASKEVETSNRNTAIIVFILLPFNNNGS